jgi:hypothetical protein
LVAVLEIPSVESAETAVRIEIVKDVKAKKNETGAAQLSSPFDAMTRKDQIICLILLAIMVSSAAVFMLVDDLSLTLKTVLGIVGILCWVFIMYLRRFKPRC